jgi:DNA-binding XRE family transcriptional regulator
LQQNKTQQHVAIAAGINRSTMVQIEKGAGVEKTLTTDPIRRCKLTALRQI